MDTDTDWFLSLDMFLKPDPPMYHNDVRYYHVTTVLFLPRNQRQDVMGEQLFYGQITRGYFMFYSLAMTHYFNFDLSCKQEKIIQRKLCANHDGLAHTFARTLHFLYDCRKPEKLYAHAMVAAHTGHTRPANCSTSFFPGQAYCLQNLWHCIFISIRLYFLPRFYLWTFFLPSHGVRGRGLFCLLPHLKILGSFTFFSSPRRPCMMLRPSKLAWVWTTTFTAHHHCCDACVDRTTIPAL